MRVRPLCAEDAAWAGALAEASGHPSYRPDRLLEALEGTRTRGFALLDAEGGGEGAGFALFDLVAPEAELHFVGIAPERRGRGLGRALLEWAHAALANEGIELVFLEVSEANHAARRLYEGLRYAPCGRRPHYYPDGEAAVVMRLEF